MPWINIYAIGAILIVLLTRKLKKYPVLVVLVAMAATGILEFVAGWAIFKIGNGTRYWDYNNEILNFGNIGGFICLGSVLFFGISALFLMYILLPFCIYLSKIMTRKAFLILAISLCAVFLLDEAYNFTASKIFTDLPNAVEIYKSLGFKYVEV